MFETDLLNGISVWIHPPGQCGWAGGGLRTGEGFKRLGRSDVTMQTDAPPLFTLETGIGLIYS